MHISVKLLNGDSLKFDISENSCTIGRSSKCEVVIPHDGISRQHCLIEANESEIFVTDLGSTNGVMIEGEKIKPHVRTPFKTFLPLSFGPVQSMLVSLNDDATSSSENPLLKGLSADGPASLTRTTMNIRSSKTSVTKPVVNPVTKTAPAKSQSKSADLKLILATIMAVLIIIAAYYYHQVSEKSSVPSPVGDKKNSAPVEYY